MRDSKGRFVKGGPTGNKNPMYGRTGDKNPMYGKPGTKGHLGHKHSEETKKKISLAKKGKRCSIATEFKKGMKPWSYIDGRSKLLGPARYGDDWDKIRYVVYLRDGFKCQDCGIKSTGKRPLDVHHKIPFLISKDNSLENLIALCRKCHMKADRKWRAENGEMKIDIKKITVGFTTVEK